MLALGTRESAMGPARGQMMQPSPRGQGPGTAIHSHPPHSARKALGPGITTSQTVAHGRPLLQPGTEAEAKGAPLRRACWRQGRQRACDSEYQPADRASPAPGAKKHVVQEGRSLATSWKDWEGPTGGGHASGPWGRQEVSTGTHRLALARAAGLPFRENAGSVRAGTSPSCSWPNAQQMNG